MWPRFGIKIGNSTLCIAYVRTDGKIEVIANSQGDRTSQACLLWDGRTNEIECGLTAKQKMSLRPKQAVANSFQFLQMEKDMTTQLEKALKHISCDYNVENHKFKLKYEEPSENSESKIHVHELSAYEVQVHLLRTELELAHQYHNDKSNKPIVVLSIPSYYEESARTLLAQVAAEAGFHVAQIIVEPTAALLAYHNNLANVPMTLDNTGNKCILTIKSGGIYSHFGLYEVKGNFYTLKKAFGPFNIGGNNYTDALTCFICSEFQRKHKLDPHESRRSMAKIRNSAANCKHVLTTMPSTQIYIDSLMDGLDFNMQMSRARFESLIQPVIVSFMQTLHESLNHEDVAKITYIVLLGATMQIPKLKAAVTAQFPQAEILASIPSDEVVAVGCARQATFLAQPGEQHFEFREMMHFAADKVLIWHGEDDSQAEVLLDKGALIPHRVLLKVPSCKKTENLDLFQVRFGNTTKPIHVHGIKPSHDKMFCLEAEIAYVEDEQLPLVRLRCGLA